MRPAANSGLPALIQHQNTQAKGNRQKEILDRHLAGGQRGLQLRHVQPENGDAEGEGDGGEQPQVLRGLVEGGRVLEDAQAARAHGHQREPLHDDQVDEVDAAGLVLQRRVRVGVHVAGRGAEAEPQQTEGNAVALQVPVRHGEAEHRLDHADEAVRLQDQFPVDQSVLFGFARWPQEYVGFGFFECENSCGGAVREAAVFLVSFFFVLLFMLLFYKNNNNKHNYG
jgi:hypothetical protein